MLVRMFHLPVVMQMRMMLIINRFIFQVNVFVVNIWMVMFVCMPDGFM